MMTRLLVCRAKSGKDDGYDNEVTGPHGFTADIEVNDDGAEVDDQFIDEEEVKSEEPDDGEDLDDRVDE